ncbi:Hint domain-containing protein [Rhizobium mesoamericanum]|uniref:Hedgehog/Intein (Hint) domain-containing protein n=1 Tax=Rhizobium mesoamericanum STM3625 TaxID=1211777 RepID=K0Q268_9HYPH|nr:Hint domain-containing protein [Rhizobium mesoamericanum]CCM78182.1 conserved exported hypothetical protein [Rhizobium mesoamericanum STM3625]
MPRLKDPKLPRNTARRHFLGVATAAGARVAALAMAASSLPARAAGLHLGLGTGNDKSEGAQCFLRGTSILTDCGKKRVEDLQTGDRVVLLGGDTSPIKWVGLQVFRKTGACWCEDVVPIRVARHALGNGKPDSDLYLSPGHALFLNGVLIRVKDLVNGTTIAPIAPHDQMAIEYYAVLLATHQVILAEGAAAETFHPSASNRENFSNFPQYERLYAGEEHQAMSSYATVLGEEGGWQHLKALLLLGAWPLVPRHDPFEDAYEMINTQAKELSI